MRATPPRGTASSVKGVTDATADAWIAAWGAQAARDGLAPRGLLGGGLGVDRSPA